MSFYPVILVLHIIAAVVWLSMIPADILLRRMLPSTAGVPEKRVLISFWLKLLNITGIIGLTGLLITGIILVFILPWYGFFVFTDNHWLATKQVIMVILLAITGASIIPSGKKLRIALQSSPEVTAEAMEVFGKLSRLSAITGILVAINFLLAITHRYIG